MLNRVFAKAKTVFEKKPKPLGFRKEHFGGIAQLTKPRALVFVDQAFAEELTGVPNDSVQTEIHERPLSAPLEAHLQLTNRCDAGCKGCYTGASSTPAPGEQTLSEWKLSIDELASHGVFHLALGGGESADLPWIGEIASYASKKGLVPNLTTSGLSGLENILPVARLFGQINVSIDGIGDDYRQVRGFDGFKKADNAVKELRKVTKNIGINVVVTRKNFDKLEELFSYAKRRRLSEIELLRFKPSGRGSSAYKGLSCSQTQHREFFPTIRRLVRKFRVRTKVDCSYTPMLTHHKPSPKDLKELAVYGCTAGDFLIGVKPNGAVSACSFAPPDKDRPTIEKLRSYWNQPTAFEQYRNWRELPEPCSSCAYLELCRGGCRVVSRHVTGTIAAPDPECPRVFDHQKKNVTTRFLPVV